MNIREEGIRYWLMAGGDASRAFHDIHDQSAFESKEMFRIGRVAPPRKAKGHRRDGERKLLHPQQWVSFLFNKERKYRKKTFIYSLLNLQKIMRENNSDYPPGQHVLLSIQSSNDFIVRPIYPYYILVLQKKDEGKLVFFN